MQVDTPIGTGIPPKLEYGALKDIVSGPGDVEWRYEMRRECQEILPGLMLGPFIASKSLDILKSLNITHIVCIRDAKEAFSVKPRFPDNFVYLTLDVEDNEEQNLIRLFPSYKRFIDAALAAGGRVLVHCNGGISLSPAFVVMYVMQFYQLDCEDALHLVQNRRYCISPNIGFLQQIKEYEVIYKATVAVHSYGPQTRAVPRRKREDDDEEEEREILERQRPPPKDSPQQVWTLGGRPLLESFGPTSASHGETILTSDAMEL